MHTFVDFTQLARLSSPSLAAALFASVWQSLLLTAGVGIVLRLVRGVSPTVRTAVWAGTLLLVLLLPVLTLLVPHAAATAGKTELHLAQGWSLGLLAVWLLFSLVRAGQLAHHAARLMRLAGRAKPVPTDGDLAAVLNGSRKALLCVSHEVNRPSVAGFFRPRVLLPVGLLETLTPAELEHVVLHEMEHLRRGDDWLNLVQQISLVLFPLNPALLWLDRTLCRERELACDDGVLAATHARKAYAACLVRLAEDSLVRKGLTLALSALGTRAKESELVGRVRRILSGPERVEGGLRARLSVASVVTVSLLSAGMFVRGPEWVRFDGGVAPAMQADAATVPAGVSSPMLPVPAMMQAVGADRAMRPVMTSAVMGGRSGVRPVLDDAVAMQPRSRMASARRVSKAVPLALSHRRVQAGVVETKVSFEGGMRRSFEPVLTAARMPHLNAARGHDATAPEGHVVVTEFEASQPMYAAVAVQGGWLILEL